MSEYVLELKGITKIFPGVKALNNVQFQLKPGEVHALMGENGAGKSTFIKVITGVHKAEEGEMFLNGQKVDFKGPKDAQEAGIAAVYQHPTSYPHLTVAENIFMGHEIIKHHMIQWKEMNQEANKYLKELDAVLSGNDAQNDSETRVHLMGIPGTALSWTRCGGNPLLWRRYHLENCFRGIRKMCEIIAGDGIWRRRSDSCIFQTGS